MHPPQTALLIRSALAIALGMVVLAACGGSPTSTPRSTSTPKAASAPEVVGLLAASDFVVGENRFPFGLATISGELIESAQVHARFYLLREDGPDVLMHEADAFYRKVVGVTPHTHEDGNIHEHPEVHGVYVADDVVFAEPGIWQAIFDIRGGPDPQTGTVAFRVLKRSLTLDVGDPVVPSENPTAGSVQDLSEITTHHPPVQGLYQFTVGEALEQEKPLLVAFTTPAFCVSSMCGPVTDVVAQLYERFGERVSFIHIEPWDLELARNEGRLVLTEVAREWRLPTEPWVFVADAQGTITARYEGLVTNEELAQALEAVVQ